ncbi:MAG: peroxiredoxin [Blastochloris viridis]|uniref:Thioredoxin peroxidase n=1 Tax=Blastochloris viridis TaxID=1079 RepID=A0A6N4R9G2_BLAVI|nr:MAG: peroxiredoxin [Blastochloris viridis]
MMMVGDLFPVTSLPAVLADGSMNNDYEFLNKDGYTVVFFYPADFTFVCPTELVAFDKAKTEFDARNTKVVGVSVDSVHSHAAWRRTPLNQGGIGEINYPLLSDFCRDLSDPLGILNEDGVTYRASYLLDKEGKIRHFVVNDLPLGRSVNEMLRMVDALAFFEENGQVCPAGWQKGEAGMGADLESTSAYLSKAA